MSAKPTARNPDEAVARREPLRKVIDALFRVTGKLPHLRSSTSDRWQGICPAHQDHHPSLSVEAMPDGKVLIHCHAGCDPTEILDALNLKWTDLEPNGKRTRPVTWFHAIEKTEAWKRYPATWRAVAAALNAHVNWGDAPQPWYRYKNEYKLAKGEIVADNRDTAKWAGLPKTRAGGATVGRALSAFRKDGIVETESLKSKRDGSRISLKWPRVSRPPHEARANTGESCDSPKPRVSEKEARVPVEGTGGVAIATPRDRAKTQAPSPVLEKPACRSNETPRVACISALNTGAEATGSLFRPLVSPASVSASQADANGISCLADLEPTIESLCDLFDSTLGYSVNRVYENQYFVQATRVLLAGGRDAKRAIQEFAAWPGEHSPKSFAHWLQKSAAPGDGEPVVAVGTEDFQDDSKDPVPF